MKSVQKLTLGAMFLALGLLLPFLTGQIQAFGTALLPMHFPVIFCGLICGWKYGLCTGLLTPILRSLFFGMPILFPQAIAMGFELATLGALAGLIYMRARKQNLSLIFIALIASMVLSRVVFAFSKTALLAASQPGSGAGQFIPMFWGFLSSSFMDSIPGIVLMLVLVPLVLLLLDRTGLIRFHKDQLASVKEGS